MALDEESTVRVAIRASRADVDTRRIDRTIIHVSNGNAGLISIVDVRCRVLRFRLTASTDNVPCCLHVGSLPVAAHVAA